MRLETDQDVIIPTNHGQGRFAKDELDWRVRGIGSNHQRMADRRQQGPVRVHAEAGATIAAIPTHLLLAGDRLTERAVLRCQIGEAFGLLD